MERHLEHSCPGLHPPHSLKNFNRDFPGVSLGKLSFRLLPPGTGDIKQLIEYYAREARQWRNGREIQLERIEALMSLKPRKRYVGTKGYIGYILFEFDWSNSAVLECPLYGNATYVLSADWGRMIRLNKAELRNYFVGHFTKVVHKRFWLTRVRAALEGRSFAECGY